MGMYADMIRYLANIDKSIFFFWGTKIWDLYHSLDKCLSYRIPVAGCYALKAIRVSSQKFVIINQIEGYFSKKTEQYLKNLF